MARQSLALPSVLGALTLLSSAHAQTTPTLQQAITTGQASAHFHGTGGSSGDTVMVEVSKGPKASSRPLTVSVPPGSPLYSSQAGAQSMMVLGVAGRVTGPRTYSPSDDIVIPATGTATYILHAFCAEFHKDNPSGSTSFTLHLPDAALACIARQCLKVHPSLQATQAAVWMYTDHLTLEEMNRKFAISSSDWRAARKIVSACGVTPK